MYMYPYSYDVLHSILSSTILLYNLCIAEYATTCVCMAVFSNLLPS